MLAIHWQALRLWLKKAPFHPHPALEARMMLFSKIAANEIGPNFIQ